MTTTPPPMPEPTAWYEYARKKPALRRLVFARTSLKDLRVTGHVAEALIAAGAVEARDAQWMERIAALETENALLRKLLGDSLSLIDKVWAHDGDVFGVLHNASVDFEAAARAALEKTHD